MHMPTLLYLYQLHGDVLESREAARRSRYDYILLICNYSYVLLLLHYSIYGTLHVTNFFVRGLASMWIGRGRGRRSNKNL